MPTFLSCAYLLVALLSVQATARGMKRLRRRRGEHLQRTELGILWGTVVLAGLAWPLITPIFLWNWGRHRGPALLSGAAARIRAATARLTRRGRTASAPDLPPARRAAPTQHNFLRSATGAVESGEGWIYDVRAGRPQRTGTGGF